MSSPSSTEPTAPVATAGSENYASLVTSPLIGSLLSFFFFGTLLIQVYIYRLCFPKDFLGVKFSVYFIFLAMMVCTCLMAADIEAWFGTGFGDISGFSDARNSSFYIPLMGSFIGMLIQLFFAYRIVAIRRAAWPFGLLTSLIALAQCAGGMGAGIITYMDGNATHDNLRTIFVYLWLIGGATVNVLIAGTMTCLLLADAKTAAERTFAESAVRMLIETNILTAVVSLLALLLFLACPDTTYWVCPAMILPGLYANTLLVTLNNRAMERLGSDSTTASRNVSFPSASMATANSRSPLTRTATVYSTTGLGRVLSVPAMSFARQENAQGAPEKNAQEKLPRSSVERQWRDGEDADSESEYESENEYGTEGVRV
ncbi:hypothetical protein K438DRAFT_1992289 [Mycena galopus ATCC 62051]|nr:hypothetical protein K438DRAFT_1742239 [Mycena galopus ATCC 62051]KAF8144922.1 hypothetical protein K438DRAFT_1992289 [Mycena galopus ATCC 62051]